MRLTVRIVMAVASLLSGLGVLRVSYAITGCTNAYLTGTYNAQISSANFMNVLNALNTPAGSTSKSTTGGPASGTTSSLPGLGQLFLDGNGNIVGTSASSPNMIIGSYTVNTDCTGTANLNSGQTFYIVVAANGAQAMFMESDAAGGGSVGVLDRSTTACIGPGSEESFAFSYFGAQAPTGTSTPMFLPAAAVGSISLDGQGNFSMKEWVYANGSAMPVNAAGSYTIDYNCNLVLSFRPGSGATTGSAANAPAALRGLLVSGSMGLILVQTDQAPTDLVPGTFVAQ